MEKQTKSSFQYKFHSPKSAKAIYNLLLDIPSWWSGLYNETITGNSKQLNDEFMFRAGGGAHNTRQKLVSLEPQKTVEWLVTESDLNFLEEPEEWQGTKIRFDLEPDVTGTIVRFTHEGLTPQMECYEGCTSAWTGYLKNLETKLNS